MDGVLEVDLYDQQLYLDCRLNTPLLYQPLIDRGCMKLNRYVTSDVETPLFIYSRVLQSL